MLKRGQIIRVPKDADLVMLREMKKQGLGNMLGVPGGSKFTILQALVGQDGIEQGDYMAVRPGWTTFYLIPKAMAEGWDLEVDPAQEDERRTLEALQAELDKARSDLEEARLTIVAERATVAAIPFEALAVARFYRLEHREFWTCLVCGCDWPRDIVTACANCHGPKGTDVLVADTKLEQR